MKILALGLGPIGQGIVKNLCTGGHVVFAYDRNPNKVMKSQCQGAKGLNNIADFPIDIDAVFVLVNNGHQVLDLLFNENNIAGRLPPGTLILMGTTVAPGIAMEVGDKCAELGVVLVECPLSGGARGAEAGNLTIITATSVEGFDRAKPILDVVAGHVEYLGPKIGRASLMKIANQISVAINLAGAAEVMAYAGAVGLERTQVFEVLSRCSANSWIWQDRVSRYVSDDKSTRSKISTLHKDIEIIRDSVPANLVKLPNLMCAKELVDAAIDEGLGDEDDVNLIDRAAKFLCQVEL